MTTTLAAMPSTAAVYDSLAAEYDERYASPACQLENAHVADLARALVRDVPTPLNVLDLGAGTGLALDLKIMRAEECIAVDPSSRMLHRLRAKHPDTAFTHAGTLSTFLDLVPSPNFDLVLGLFGVGSYLTQADLYALSGLLEARRGVAFLMTYNGTYRPDYYDADPPTKAPAEQALRALASARRARYLGTLTGKYGLWLVV